MTPYLHSLPLLFGAQSVSAAIHLLLGERLVLGPTALLCLLGSNAVLLWVIHWLPWPGGGDVKLHIALRHERYCVWYCGQLLSLSFRSMGEACAWVIDCGRVASAESGR